MHINNFVKWEETLKMPTVLFIRHAESEANAGKPTAHPTTIKITPKGFEQAKSVASFFTREPDLIITSPYKRTYETAQPTFARFPHAPHEEWPVEEFTYLTPLDTFTTSLERKPMVETFWKRDDPSYVDGDEVESFTTFIDRVQNMIKRLRQTKEDYIVVFSHEQFICAILWLFLKSKLEPGSTLCSDCKRQFKDFLTMCRLPNGAILPIQLQDGNETWVGNIITSHLLP
jgi:2,3-bisphosphoglycerate-dependent phosphoglycerate mutase